MRVTITLEHRFLRTPGGRVWTQTESAYSVWEPLLEVFERVQCVARIREVQRVPTDWVRADGDGVTFIAVPPYHGPLQYLGHLFSVRRSVRAALDPRDAIILRNGNIGDVARKQLRIAGKGFAVNVVSDPYDAFSPGAIDHPLRPVLRRWAVRQLRRQCQQAFAVCYVTNHALQLRYPTSGRQFAASDVQLPDSAFVERPREYERPPKPIRLITVGSMDRLYKAQDVLIRAVANSVMNGLPVSLDFIGDGRQRSKLERLAREHGVRSQVRFCGQLPAGEPVRRRLDCSDLFVLPSRQEGLPRAMIEAMARALPCLGSIVGGIPELLPREDLVPPGDEKALSRKIEDVAAEPERLTRMSQRNLETARDYTESVLVERRLDFWREVRAKTALELRSGIRGKPSSASAQRTPRR